MIPWFFLPMENPPSHTMFSVAVPYNESCPLRETQEPASASLEIMPEDGHCLARPTPDFPGFILKQQAGDGGDLGFDSRSCSRSSRILWVGFPLFLPASLIAENPHAPHPMRPALLLDCGASWFSVCSRSN